MAGSISIHALLAESDQLYDTYAKVLRVFLSTLSLRRATWAVFLSCNYPFISIHALLAESDRTGLTCGDGQNISIHALLAESDLVQIIMSGYARISIHALLAESDASGTLSDTSNVISIHALLAESDTDMAKRLIEFRISIHALLAESDEGPAKLPKQIRISIHALLAESDSKRLCNALEYLHFYPRSPCGERQHVYLLVLWVLRFLSTLSLRRATERRHKSTSFHKLFLSTLSLRRATTLLLRLSFFDFYFYPRSPCGERQSDTED